MWASLRRNCAGRQLALFREFRRQEGVKKLIWRSFRDFSFGEFARQNLLETIPRKPSLSLQASFS
jgi:hypothetical protein